MTRRVVIGVVAGILVIAMVMLLRRWWVANALEQDRLRRQTAAAQQAANTWQLRYASVTAASREDSILLDSQRRQVTKDSTQARASEKQEHALRIQFSQATTAADSLPIALAGWAAADDRASSWERTALAQMHATMTAERDRDRWKQLVADTAAGADRTIADLREALADEARWRESSCKVICIKANGTVAALAAAGGVVIGWVAHTHLRKD